MFILTYSHNYSHSFTHTHTHTPLQAALKAAKQELDQLKSALRERNKELQKFEQERRSHEKEKVNASLKIKELEHKIAKFHKDSKDAAQKVRISSTVVVSCPWTHISCIGMHEMVLQMKLMYMYM